MVLKTFFSGGAIERSADIRCDSAALARVWQDSGTRFVAVWNSRCLIRDNTAVLLTREQLTLSSDFAEIDNSIYLGQLNNAHLFALILPDNLAQQGVSESDFANFRGLMSGLPADDAALLAYAKGMVEWRNRHRYCGLCGSLNQGDSGGFVMVCSNPACKHRSFPRIDPAIIVLVSEGERCLLGRQQTWPEGRFSTLAGFVEPGESLEDAVRREVKEESNIDVAVEDVIYQGSQPWPFPTGMMVGFHAAASSTAIKLNDGELAEARWFSRDDITAGSIVLPPPTSIAYRLIAHWFDQWPGPALDTFALSGSFSKSTGERT